MSLGRVTVDGKLRVKSEYKIFEELITGTLSAYT